MGLRESRRAGDSADEAFRVLNTWSSSPSLEGKALTAPAPTVWLRANLSPERVRWVTAHEARHVWQQFNLSDERLYGFAETDADEYAEDFLRRFDAI